MINNLYKQIKTINYNVYTILKLPTHCKDKIFFCSISAHMWNVKNALLRNIEHTLTRAQMAVDY